MVKFLQMNDNKTSLINDPQGLHSNLFLSWHGAFGISSVIGPKLCQQLLVYLYSFA